MPKLAIKVGADKPGYEHIKTLVDLINFDFIELMPLMDGDFYKSFKDFNIPVTIHAPHEGLGSNPADKKVYDRTLKCFNEGRKAADFFNSPVIVSHLGLYVNKDGNEALPDSYSIDRTDEESLRNAMDFLEGFNDSRIMPESLIYLNEYRKGLCSNAKEIKKFTDKFGYKICLDFAHATLTEHSRERGYKEVIGEFMKLNPKYFHICGGEFNNHKTEHSDIFTGDFDIPFFKGLIPEDGWLVFETPKTPIETRIKEIQYFRNEIEFFRK